MKQERIRIEREEKEARRARTIEKEVGLKEGALTNGEPLYTQLLINEHRETPQPRPESALPEESPASLDAFVTEMLRVGVSKELSSVFRALFLKLEQTQNEVIRQGQRIDTVRSLVESILVDNAKDTLALTRELGHKLEAAVSGGSEDTAALAQEILAVSMKLNDTLELSTQHPMTHMDMGGTRYPALMETLIGLRVDIQTMLYGEIVIFNDYDGTTGVQDPMEKKLEEMEKKLADSLGSQGAEIASMANGIKAHERKLSKELAETQAALHKSVNRKKELKKWVPR